MATYIIKDSEGNHINTIEASLEFVQANYTYYEEDLGEIVSAEEESRQWRDSELVRTDILAVLPDYPNKTSLLEYRQALRDWTDTEDFPETRPVMGG